MLVSAWVAFEGNLPSVSHRHPVTERRRLYILHFDWRGGDFLQHFSFERGEFIGHNPAMFHFPKLYPITDCQLSNCTHEEIVRMMLAGGARLIQLRDKEASAKELLDAARA